MGGVSQSPFIRSQDWRNPESARRFKNAETSAATRWGGRKEPTSGPMAPGRVRDGDADEDIKTLELIWTSAYQIKACIIS